MKEVTYKIGYPNKIKVSNNNVIIDILDKFANSLGNVIRDKKKPVRSSRIGSFALANVDFDNLSDILEFAKQNDLSVSPLINVISRFDVLTFGVSNLWDIDFAKSWVIGKDVPIINLNKDPEKAVEAIVSLTREKISLEDEFGVEDIPFRALKETKLLGNSVCGIASVKRVTIPEETVVVTDQYIKFYDKAEGYTFVPYRKTADPEFAVLNAIVNEYYGV